MIRSYQESDYDAIKELYSHLEWYGGVFDEARDGREVLAIKITQDPEAILVYTQDGEITGTISIIEDGRVAWLYRFVVKDFDEKVTRGLYDVATGILKSRGHTEVLVYSSVDDTNLDARYQSLGMTKGGNYACFRKEINDQ